MDAKHKAILQRVQELGGTATATQIADTFQHWYYANGRQHVLAIVKTLTKRKQLVNVKHGLYKLNLPDGLFSNQN